MSDDDTGGPDNEVSPANVDVPRDAEGDADWQAFDDLDLEPAPMQAVMGPDGLPTLPDQTSKSTIPILSKETMVCMGDFSEFVIREAGFREVIATFTPMEVDQAPSGGWRVPLDLAMARSGRSDSELAPYRAGGHTGNSKWCVVQPVRPPCKHYVRQLLPPESIENATKGLMMRACAARRDTSGAMMGLSDAGMLACSIREPRAVDNETKLDEFDIEKARQGAERTYVNMFENITAGGVFGPGKDD